MEDAHVVLERHEQQINNLKKDVSDMKAVQSEIHTMNETLITLTMELKHATVYLDRHEKKIDEMERQPRARLSQIVTAIISALSGGLIAIFLETMFG